MAGIQGKTSRRRPVWGAPVTLSVITSCTVWTPPAGGCVGAVRTSIRRLPVRVATVMSDCSGNDAAAGAGSGRPELHEASRTKVTPTNIPRAVIRAECDARFVFGNAANRRTHGTPTDIPGLAQAERLHQ